AATTGWEAHVAMSELENSAHSVKEARAAINNGEFLWGASKIAPVIGRTPRQVNHMLASGRIKSARKIGGVWFANRTARLRAFGAGGFMAPTNANARTGDAGKRQATSSGWNDACLNGQPENQNQVDPRLAFLIRAAVRFDLVESGEMGLDEAFDGLVPA